MSRFLQRIEEAKRVFLAEAMDAAQEEVVELVRSAFASVMPARVPSENSARSGKTAVSDPVARTAPRATDTSSAADTLPILVTPAVAAACPKIAACVAAHPGISVSALVGQLGMHSEKVRLALRALTADGAVRCQTISNARGGQARSYFPVATTPNAVAVASVHATAPAISTGLEAAAASTTMSDLAPVVEHDRGEPRSASTQRGALA